MLGCNRWARVQKTQFMNGYEGHYVSIEEYNFTLLLKAAIIAGKKEGALTNFRDVRDQYHKMSMELEQKREVAKEAGGGEVLKGEDVSYRPTLTDPNTHRHTHTLNSRWTTLADTHTHTQLWRRVGRKEGMLVRHIHPIHSRMRTSQDSRIWQWCVCLEMCRLLQCYSDISRFVLYFVLL